jgi:hypothetical protein
VNSAAAGGVGGDRRIFWLDGMAGTGKSTIARTVARRCCSDGRLGATFFFSRGGGELETARTFVTTIAVQLARHNSQLQTGICDAVRAEPDIGKKMLSDQLQQLVLGPCARLRAAGALPAAPLVIVVDALGCGRGRVCAAAAGRDGGLSGGTAAGIFDEPARDHTSRWAAHHVRGAAPPCHPPSRRTVDSQPRYSYVLRA